MFLTPRITRHPTYPTLLSTITPKSRILDIGCCYGTDIRALILDGVKPSKITAADLLSGYWELGLKLFSDSSRIKDVRTVWGDFASTDGVELEKHGLKHSNAFVSAQLVLHVFSKEQCEAFVKKVWDCLSSGGWFFGMCVGSVVEGPWKRQGGGKRWLHSKESLSSLLREIGFQDIDVDIGSENWVDEVTGQVEGSDGKTLLMFAARKT